MDISVFEIFPQSVTPPEPAPPDYVGAMKKNSQMIASSSSIDEITSMSGSRESLLTHDTGWVNDSMFIHSTQNDSLWINNYSKHAFTTGRHHNKSRFENSNHTLKQPGKLNMNDYTLVTDAITRMNLISGKEYNSGDSYNYAPLATPENVDLGSEYSQVKDVVQGHYPFDGNYSYTMVQDNVTASTKLRQKEKKNYSDSDSDGRRLCNSSNDTYFSKLSRRPATQKRSKKKRTAIPVSMPKVPSFSPSANGSNISFYSEETNSEILNANSSQMLYNTINHQPNSDSSTDNSDDKSNFWAHSSIRLMEKKPLRYKRKLTAPKPPVVPLFLVGNREKHCYNVTENETMFCTRSTIQEINNFDEESSVDTSLPRLLNSPSTIGNLKEVDDKSVRRKHKQISKEELKLEKKRLKAEKLKKKTKKKTVKSDVSLITHQSLLEHFVQSEKNVIPLLLEKCVTFIEFEGLNSEGLYRVPGNRSHVELLFQKFEEDNNINIVNLDIPVNAVATALKDFFSKKLPPLFTDDLIDELEELSIIADRNCRLMSLKDLLKKLPNVNFEILKFIFGHFAKVAENCKSNNMDSKNLAICWWPTLLPIEFNDMERFEQLRPHLEDTVQTMIDQQPFLFCGKEAYVMV